MYVMQSRFKIYKYFRTNQSLEYKRCVPLSLVMGLLFRTSMGLNCFGIIRIESEGLLNYLANVTFSVPNSLEGDWTLDMETSDPFTFLGGWGVWVKSLPEDGKANFRSRLENYTLAEGDQVSFRFRISWFTGEPRPLATSLKWGEIQLCHEFKNLVEPVKAYRRRRTDERQRERRVHYRKRYFVNL